MLSERDRVQVLLTFDFEEWQGKWGRYEADLYGKTLRVVELLEERGLPATFFLDAETTLKYPKTAKLLAEKGFELALHSDRHFSVSNSHNRDLDFSVQDSETQISRMKNAISIIREVIPDFDPKGFRAPGLVWNEALYVSLSRLNFLYDSSQSNKYSFKPFFKNGVMVIPMNSSDYDTAAYSLGVHFVVSKWIEYFGKAQDASARDGEAYYLLLAHPAVSGRYKYLVLLRAILNHMSWSRVEYLTCNEFATKYLERTNQLKPLGSCSSKTSVRS